jgi:hypothetical protein
MHPAKPNVLRKKCSRHGCEEGKIKNGAVVTFNKIKKKGGSYKECDQCKDHTDQKNPVSNKKVNIVAHAILF